MCYPGHYAFVVIVGVVAIAVSPRRIRAAIGFGGAAVIMVGLIELLARIAGTSYIQNVLAVSGAITMGLFSEGYVFAWRYLRDVEGVIGIALYVLFLGFAVLVLWRPGASIPRPARVAIIAAVLCYLVHASMGVLFERMVFYGRILLMYIPFVVGGAVLGLMHLRWRRLRRAGVCVLVLASMWSFVTFAHGYTRMTYPVDFFLSTLTEEGCSETYPPYVLWDMSEDIWAAPVDHLGPDSAMVTDTRPDGSEAYVRLASHDAALASGARFIGVNLKWMFYIRERHDCFEAPAGYRLVAEALHPNAFTAVGYEGHKPWERRRLRERRYTMRVYERITDEGELTDMWHKNQIRAGPGS
jgi:hypothetical protein